MSHNVRLFDKSWGETNAAVASVAVAILPIGLNSNCSGAPCTHTVVRMKTLYLINSLVVTYLDKIARTVLKKWTTLGISMSWWTLKWG